MAFGKKKKQKKNQQTAQQPTGVKVDKSNNPFYPPRKESLAKEIGTTLGVIAVSLVLVGVITMNFSYVAIAERSNRYQYDEYMQAADAYGEDYENMDNESAAEDSQDITVGEQDTLEQPYESPGKVIEEPIEAPAATPTPQVVSGDYIIPDSDVRYITYADLENLTAEQLRIARNEIYARHGRMFKDAALQAYFNSKDWYTGTIAPDNFTQEMLSEVERANTATISDYEDSKGY